MRKMKRILPALLLLILNFSCEKDNSLLEGRHVNSLSIAPVKYEVVVEEEDTTYQIREKLEVMEFPGRNIATVGTISQGEVGAILYLGIGKSVPSDPYREEFLLSLRFEVGGLDPTVAPSQNDLRNYFTVGREFSIGHDAGEVQLGMLLPTGGLLYQRSLSAYLESPEGTVRIDRIEPYVAPLPESEGGDREYMMITFEFTGEIGVFDPEEEFDAQVRRIPYIASKKAFVSGTTTLVLAATPG